MPKLSEEAESIILLFVGLSSDRQELRTCGSRTATDGANRYGSAQHGCRTVGTHALLRPKYNYYTMDKQIGFRTLERSSLREIERILGAS